MGAVKNIKGLPWRDRRLIVAIAIIYAITQLITFLRTYSQLRLDNDVISINSMLRDRIVAWVVGVVFAFIIVLTTRQLLQQRNWSWLRISLIHLAFSSVFSVVWYATLIGVHKLFCKGKECHDIGQDLFFWFLINFDKLFLLYLVTVSITYTYYYVMRDHYNKLQHAQMQTQLLQARLKMLHSQLQPHFLFNTLNSISSLMDIDVERAKIMIADLAELLRRVLDQKDVQIVSLSNELDLLEKYVNIEKTRFSDDLTICWDIDETLLATQVPSMVLQPLVENAIRHGFSKKHLELAITIRAYTQEGNLCLSVCDNGQGLKHAAGKDIFQQGMGLQNTRERLQSIYGDAFQFSLRDTQEGTCSLIVLPLTYGAAEVAYPAAVIPVNQLSDV